MSAADVVPVDADLPGTGWLAVDEGFGREAGSSPGAVFDCVGPGFPDAAVVASAASPHFLRPPATLVHGLGVEFDSARAAEAARAILRGASFAACLGRSVAADLGEDVAAGGIDAELIAVDVAETDSGHRVRFTGADERGVRPVNLDIATVRSGNSVGVLWCGHSPEPFPTGDLEHLLTRLHARG